MHTENGLKGDHRTNPTKISYFPFEQVDFHSINDEIKTNSETKILNKINFNIIKWFGHRVII